MVIQTGDNKFGVAKWIVDSTAGLGTHTTIASAIASAASGDTIVIRPKSTPYTENLSITNKNLNIVAFTGDSDIPNVVILGKISISGAISVSFSNIELRTNGDYFLEVTGSSATEVNINNCYLNCLNFTGTNFTTSSASAVVIFDRCEGNLGAAGTAFFASTSTGTVAYYYCTFSNSGSSTTASTISAGIAALRYTYFTNPITSSGTAGIGINHSVLTGINTTMLTHGGSVSSSIFDSTFISGTATAISVGGTLTLTNSSMLSSNTNVIDGAGSITYSGLVFIGTSSNISTAIQTVRNEGPSRTIGSANSAGTNTLTVTNSSNTASSIARILTSVGGTSSDDPYHTFTVTGGTSWSQGIDNSDSDKLKICEGTALTANDTFVIASGGASSFLRGNVDVTRSANGADVSLTASNSSNTASSTATVYATVAGSTANDPRVQYAVSGSQIWTHGIDNSVSGDPFVLSASGTLGTTNVMSISTAGEINTPLQPAFLALASGSQTNVTGDGTAYTVLFGNEITDQGSDYNTGTSTFTAPATGFYHFSCNVAVSGLTASHTTATLTIVTTARTYLGTACNIGAIRNASDVAALHVDAYANMTVNDTATIVLTITGGTKVVVINATGGNSFFSGMLVA